MGTNTRKVFVSCGKMLKAKKLTFVQDRRYFLEIKHVTFHGNSITICKKKSYCLDRLESTISYFQKIWLTAKTWRTIMFYFLLELNFFLYYKIKVRKELIN